MLLHIIWDPSPYLFNAPIPLLGRPLLWYGALFALGFFIAYLVLRAILRRHFTRSASFLPASFAKKSDGAKVMAEKLSFYLVIGGLIGAKLGDLIWYQGFQEILKRPSSLIAFWEGGLASHGGAVGILCALWIFSKRYRCKFWSCIDLVVVPVSIAAVFIRLGNFFNQEILGTATSMPWGVLFLHPADGGALVPRHPAQLYEAIAYLASFLILFSYQKAKKVWEMPGKLTGLFLILIFTSRFLIEWVKVEQSIHMPRAHLLTMGQYLSLPFIALGIYLFFKNKYKNF